MNGVDGLAAAVRQAMRKKNIPGAEKGIVEGKNVRIGSRAYPFSLAVDVLADPDKPGTTGETVDVLADEGDAVWVQRTEDGRAVIVGD